MGHDTFHDCRYFIFLQSKIAFKKKVRKAVKNRTSFFAVESSSQLYCGSLAHSIVKGMRHNAVCAIKEHTHATKVILLKTCTPHCGCGYVA